VHEAKLCLSLLDLAERHRLRAGASRIVAVRLAVGAWSGVDAEALAAAFPVCAHGTAAEGAALSWEPVPGRDLVLRDLEVV
jgi:hydrogenase nickel incorporation protein HypA/HybF